MYKLWWSIFLFGCMACSEPMPKPRGLFRIDLPRPSYTYFTTKEIPYTFEVSQLVTVEMPPVQTPENWINITYPAINVKIYCSYKKTTPEQILISEKECRELIGRSIKQNQAITEQAYENPKCQVYGTLFQIDGDSPSPIQFILTDSVSHFFRGAMYYQNRVDADSVAPITDYLRNDIIKLIESFDWK